MSNSYQRLPESAMNQKFPKDLDTNWRSGVYQRSVHDVGGDYHDFDMDDNYVVCMQSRMNGKKLGYFLKMFDRKSMKVARVIPLDDFNLFKIHGNIIMCLHKGRFKVFDVVSGQQLSEFDEPSEWKVAAFDIGYQGLVAAVASGPDGGRRLILWRMNSPLDITCLHTFPIAIDGDINLKMDEEYITIFIKQHSKEAHCHIYCISAKTLQVEYSTTLSKFDEIFYEKGHLIVYSKSEMSVFHVASQSWLTAIDVKSFGKCVRFIKCRANSKYLAAVIGLAHEKAKVVIIDLQALKNGQCDVMDLKINFENSFDCCDFLMDETQIIVRRNYLDDSWRVYDFTPKSVATRRKRKSPQDADQKFAPKREKKSPD